MAGQSLGKDERNFMCKIYQFHQIFHHRTHHMLLYFNPFAVSTGSSLIITSTFSLIRFRSDMNVPLSILLGLVAIATFIFLRMGLELGAGITELSSQFRKSLEKTAKAGDGDVRFLRAASTLRLKIGGIFPLTSRTFASIMNDLVITAVVNLLCI